MGNDVAGLKDCSSLVQGGNSKMSRDMMGMGARFAKYAKYHT